MERTTTVIPQEDIQRQLSLCDQVAQLTAQLPQQPLAFVDTYGCQQNEADSERIRGYLRRMGYGFTDKEEEAKIIVINTCAIREHAEQKVLGNVNLPAPLDTILQVNLENLVYGTQGAVTTVSDYVSQTILQASINIICFLVCFIGLYIALSLGMNLIRAIFRFPVLKQLDSLAGGIFGLLRGVLLCLAVFTLVPLVQTMLPMDLINDLIAESQLAPIFMNGNLITAIMNKQLF